MQANKMQAKKNISAKSGLFRATTTMLVAIAIAFVCNISEAKAQCNLDITVNTDC